MSQDKAFWQGIVEQDYALPAHLPLEELTLTLLSHLGSPDPQLRTQYGYVILGRWLGQGVYSPDQVREIIQVLTSNYNYHLGDDHTDTVFLRSFSALMLATIISYDQERHFLHAGEIIQLLHQTIDYFADEKDLRGYIPDLGWAHSAAHTADLFYALAQHRHLDGNHLAHLLYAIADKVKRQTGYIFVHEEDERLARAALAACMRPTVTLTIRGAWLTRILQVFDEEKDQFDPLFHSAYLNTKTFLRSLYFQLTLGELDVPEPETLKTGLLEALSAFPH